MNYVKGKFKNIIYEGNSGFQIGLFKIIETNIEALKEKKTVTYTGYFNDVLETDTYILYGEYIKHERYGYQINVKQYEKIIPEGKDAVIEFLTSTFVKGCGEVTAKKIYKTFGDNTLTKIKENKNNLELIGGLSEKKKNQIYDSVCKYFENDELILKLKRQGFTVKETMDLIHDYGNNILDIINTNIYELTDHINFKKIDSIFLLNNDKEDSRRINACIIETIKNLNFEEGNIYLYKEDIEKGIKKYFNITSPIEEQITVLYNQRKICIESNKIYLKEDYEDEEYIANSVKKLLNSPNKELELTKVIEEVEKDINIKYDEKQKEAIKQVLTNRISIITGGPGTGKTTIIKGIINSYMMMNKIKKDTQNYILILAPTGRASKRLSEATNTPSSTIHRFLKWDKNTNTFAIDESCKQNYGLIIIDESSMIDNHLMAALFKGISLNNTQIVLVGDEYQLPSIRPGLILNDLINTNIKHIRLEQIYRQSTNSYIPNVAKNIKDKNTTIIPNGDDYSFIECNNKDIKQYIIQIIDKMNKKNIDISKLQILAPMYKGENGIDNLNIILQEIFNQQNNIKEEITIGQITYREGDKMLNLVNDLDNNIFNGDIGYIKTIYKDNKKTIIEIEYDGNIIEYKKEDLQNVTHAYAITIHKAQGSEFDHIIMPLSLEYNRMLYNKLLYTGVSRAKKTLILIGSKEAYEQAINNNYSFKRNTTLSSKIMNNNI